VPATRPCGGFAVPSIIYGYGGDDDESPLAETVDVLDKLVKEYISGMVRLTLVSSCRGRERESVCPREGERERGREGERRESVL
jgi:hypothetical protein